jgi:hypothetical protein
MTRCLLLPALLLAAAAVGAIDVFGPDGQRIGTVREGAGGRVDMYDGESRRIGWGRRNADGSLELFDQQGRRLGTVDRGRVLRISAPPGREERGWKK